MFNTAGPATGIALVWPKYRRYGIKYGNVYYRGWEAFPFPLFRGFGFLETRDPSSPPANFIWLFSYLF